MSSNISPMAYVNPKARLGENVTIYPFAFIDEDVEIGDNCVIMPNVSIMSGTRMGSGNKVYQGAVIGADPQDFRWKGEKTYCYIGNNNIIREQVIINRGIRATGGTSIGNDAFIMANAHIAHDSVIKGKCVIGNSVKVAGNVEVDECVILSSAVILHEGSKVGKWAMIKGGCRINGNVPPYVIIAHNPASYYGINAWVMRKKGFSDAQVDDVAKSYRHIYQCGTSVFNALQRVEADIADSDVRREILDFIRKVNLKIVAVPIDETF